VGAVLLLLLGVPLSASQRSDGKIKYQLQLQLPAHNNRAVTEAQSFLPDLEQLDEAQISDQCFTHTQL
jgi:hypothetical protein